MDDFEKRNEINNEKISLENNDKTMGMLSHILGLFFGFVAPAVIYFIIPEEDFFNKNHAREALNFQISIGIWLMISGILTIILVGFIGMIAFGIIDLIFSLKGASAAKNEEEFRYPFTIRFFK